MLDRCFNPKSTSYPFYGMRGIMVCERWQGGGTASPTSSLIWVRGCRIRRSIESILIKDIARITVVGEPHRSNDEGDGIAFACSGREN